MGSGDDEPAPAAGDASDPSAVEEDHPEAAIDGDAMVLAAATASVPGERVPPLVRAVGAHLRGERARYRRRYERFAADDDAETFLVPEDHWADLAEAVDLDDRAIDAVRRAHEAHARRRARDGDREEEFDAALDIRSVVVIGRPRE